MNIRYAYVIVLMLQYSLSNKYTVMFCFAFFGLFPAWIDNYMNKLSLGRNYLTIPKLQRQHRWCLGMDTFEIPHMIVYQIASQCWD